MSIHLVLFVVLLNMSAFRASKVLVSLFALELGAPRAFLDRGRAGQLQQGQCKIAGAAGQGDTGREHQLAGLGAVNWVHSLRAASILRSR